jgi:phosphoglycolate phosphatase
MAGTAVFDLDGTLVHSAPDIHAAVNRVIARRGLAPYALAEVAAMIGDGTRVLVTRALAGRGLAFDEACHAELVAEEDIGKAHLTAVFDGVVEALDRIEAAGWRLAVCTNKPQAAAEGLLASLGLGARFAAVGGGDSFSVRKPDPAHLLGTLAAAGGSPEHAVMVGDHQNDMRAAKGCGVPGIFASWGYGPAHMAEGSPVAATPADLPALIARLGGRPVGAS